MSPKSHTPFDRIFYNALSLFWVGFGVWFVRQGIQLAVVYTPGWEWSAIKRSNGCSCCRGMRETTRSSNSMKRVLLGGRTHRILNAHYCWVVATLGLAKRMVSLSIIEFANRSQLPCWSKRVAPQELL